MNQRFVISIYWATLITWVIFSQFDINLSTSEGEVFFSGSALHGIDPGKRVHWFWGAAGIFAFCLIGFRWLICRLTGYLSSRSNGLMTCAWVSGFALSAIVFELMGLVDWQWVTLLSMAALLALVLWVLSEKNSIARFLASPTVWALGAGTVIPGFFGALFLFNSSSLLSRPWWLVGLWLILFFAVIGIIKRLSRWNIRQISLFLLPVSVIPLAGFVSVETLFFFLKSGSGPIRYKWLFLGIAFLMGAAIYMWQKRKAKTSSATQLLVRWLVPFGLFGFVLMFSGWPLVAESSEMFEMANPANAQLRVFRFGEIPFIDFFTSHMFSEQYYGLIYHGIYGFQNNTEFTVYRFFTEYLFLFVAFRLLLRVNLSVPFSLGFLLVFPLTHVLFHFHLIYTVFAGLVAISLVLNPSFKRWLAFWGVLALLMVWRMDTGVAALMTAPFFLAFLQFTEKRSFSIGPFLIGSGLFFLGLIVLFLAAGLLRSVDSLAEHVQLILGYLGANREHGLPFLTHSPDHWFLIHHVLMPATALVSIAWIFFKLRSGAELSANRKTWLILSAFFFMVSVANFPRGLIRHGYPENSEFFLVGTFFIALIFLIVGVCYQKSENEQAALFGLSSLLVVLVLKFFPHDNALSFEGKILADNSLRHFDIHLASNPEGNRWNQPNTAHRNKISEFRDYLDKTLAPGQTFLDFSNHPMLYFYSERRVPGYFCQNLQNTTTNRMRKHLLEQTDLESTPLVVCSSVPSGWYDAPDGVPNFLRHYLIAEHIHRNYEPLDTIAGFAVWGLKTGAGPYVSSEVDYAMSARFAGRAIAGLNGQALPEANHQLPSPEERQNSGYWLRFKIRSDHEMSGTYRMTDSTGTDAAVAHFALKRGEHLYALRISAHPVWYSDLPLTGTFSSEVSSLIAETTLIPINE